MSGGTAEISSAQQAALRAAWERIVKTGLLDQDYERLDWLEADPRRLEDVYARVNNEGVTVRAAIDWLRQST